jgi:hypothetical protein
VHINETGDNPTPCGINNLNAGWVAEIISPTDADDAPPCHKERTAIPPLRRGDDRAVDDESLLHLSHSERDYTDKRR